jgi:hypothetical protein
MRKDIHFQIVDQSEAVFVLPISSTRNPWNNVNKDSIWASSEALSGLDCFGQEGIWKRQGGDKQVAINDWKNPLKDLATSVHMSHSFWNESTEPTIEETIRAFITEVNLACNITQKPLASTFAIASVVGRLAQQNSRYLGSVNFLAS